MTASTVLGVYQLHMITEGEEERIVRKEVNE
jgi:hypothetical protein